MPEEYEYDTAVVRIDLTRTSFGGGRVLRSLLPDWQERFKYEKLDPIPAEYTMLEDGMCMVNCGPNYVAPSTGAPDEVFAGFAVASPLNPGKVIVGWGHFHVFTVWYDADVHWSTGAGCLPVAGPNGLLTAGTYPDDLLRLVGRVVSVPRPNDPYLGISGFSHA